MLQLLGTVEEEALFRICDLVVDRDTAGALTFLEELAEQGQDLGRLVTDLLEHLRHLMLVQHLGEVPESLPVTEETRDRLREQANQLTPATVLRLIDLLAVAVEDMRQGGDPRLPLELALVKVTRPGGRPLARVDGVPARAARGARIGDRLGLRARDTGAPRRPLRRRRRPRRRPRTPSGDAAEPPSVDLEQLQEAWQRTIVPAVEDKSIPVASVLREARPAELAGDTLTLEFPPSAAFHRQLAEEPKNAGLLAGRALRADRPQARRRVRRGGRERRPARGGAERPRARTSCRADEGDLRRPRRGGPMSFDMNKLMQQAQQMQAQMAQAQEEVANEVVEASAGGGMVTVKAPARCEIKEIWIDPEAIDPDDPELLAGHDRRRRQRGAPLRAVAARAADGRDRWAASAASACLGMSPRVVRSGRAE